MTDARVPEPQPRIEAPTPGLILFGAPSPEQRLLEQVVRLTGKMTTLMERLEQRVRRLESYRGIEP